MLICFRVLVDTASNFPNSCEEVTLSCTPESIMFKNYLEDEPGMSYFLSWCF